jgi:WD40 repeat protein
MRGVAFAPDGKTLASASEDGTGKLWDVSKGMERTALKHHGAVMSVTLDRHVQLLASGGTGTVMVYEVGTGKVRATRTAHQGNVWSLAFSADDNVLASCADDGLIKLWQVPQH